MSPQLKDSLMRDYESIFTKNIQIDCDDGWYYLIKEFLISLKKDVDNKIAIGRRKKNREKIRLIKEKLGYLAIYCKNGTYSTYAKIEMTEAMSVHVCEICGNMGERKINHAGSIKTLCQNH
jgi:hypothetical protein